MQDSQIEKGIADIVEEEIKISKQAVSVTQDSIHKTVSFTTKHHLKNDVN